MVIHLELDRWIFSIESGDQNSPRLRRQLATLDRLHEKYYALHKKYHRMDASPKRCKWRFTPPASKPSGQKVSVKSKENIYRMKDRVEGF